MSLSSLSVEVGVTPLVFGLDHEGREGMSWETNRVGKYWS